MMTSTAIVIILMMMRDTDSYNDIVAMGYDDNDYYHIHSNDVLVLIISE
jgi:hypothetical protein